MKRKREQQQKEKRGDGQQRNGKKAERCPSRGTRGSEKKRKPTKFEKYLEMENVGGGKLLTAEEDIVFEKRLAKKLGLKKSKVKDIGDGLLEFTTFGEHPKITNDTNGSVSESEHDFSEEPSSDQESEDEDQQSELEEEKDAETARVESSSHCTTNPSASLDMKYIPPHQRAAHLTEEAIRLKRRIKGLLNRVSEDNLESITSELADLFLVNGRLLLTELVTNHVLESCSNGPRGNEQYATVFAGLVAGLASLVGMDFAAFFMASLASSFETAYEKEDSLAARNFTLLICSLYHVHVISSDLVYDLLRHLCGRFRELDVSTILHLIQSCGMSLRSGDPAAMKDFILSVQQKSSELKESFSKDGNESLSKRVEYMLDAICEVKNNKRKTKDEPAKHTRMKKWLQKLRVEDIQLTAVTWNKLLDPTKKGQWWHHAAENSREDTSKLMDSLGAAAGEAEKMLKLAASQRMNTDARRAIFSIVMSSDDYLDAFEKLLHLNLNGAQDREILRVIVECCLQEKMFNKYYALLASKLCQHDKNHKFTLQYCVWDHFKELPNMELRRSINLAKLLAFLVGSSAISLTVLKTIDFGDSRFMTAKVVVHFRAFFQALLSDASESSIVSVFSRVASSPELSSLASGLALFLKQHRHKMVETNSAILKRYQLVRKALNASID